MRLLLPTTLDEACDLLAGQPDAVPIAGGTDLLVHWPVRFAALEQTYLDLSALAPLRGVRWTDETLVLGALTTYWDLITDPAVAASFPLLVQAARSIGSIQIQARGTWGGNIMHASPAADGVTALMAYDAVLRLQSTDGVEEVPLAEFYRGYKIMRRRPEQLLTEIRLPRRSYDVQQFHKVGTRRAQAISKVGLAMTRRAADWRVVACSVAPTVRRCRALEQRLQAQQPMRSAADVLRVMVEDVSPIDDLRSTAVYRRTVMSRLAYHSLREACAWVE
ncbi:MAG: FAD binding domain-containing protein [Phycisphaerales bacterium JB038]